jgi:hypothetical protein
MKIRRPAVTRADSDNEKQNMEHKQQRSKAALNERGEDARAHFSNA